MRVIQIDYVYYANDVIWSSTDSFRVLVPSLGRVVGGGVVAGLAPCWVSSRSLRKKDILCPEPSGFLVAIMSLFAQSAVILPSHIDFPLSPEYT